MPDRALAPLLARTLAAALLLGGGFAGGMWFERGSPGPAPGAGPAAAEPQPAPREASDPGPSPQERVTVATELQQAAMQAAGAGQVDEALLQFDTLARLTAERDEPYLRSMAASGLFTSEGFGVLWGQGDGTFTEGRR